MRITASLTDRYRNCPLPSQGCGTTWKDLGVGLAQQWGGGRPLYFGVHSADPGVPLAPWAYVAPLLTLAFTDTEGSSLPWTFSSTCSGMLRRPGEASAHWRSEETL